jgi:tetratricopeptide (TPR) repeat protein
MKKKSVIYFGIALSLIIAGCSGVKGLFSKGQDELKLANQAWEKGDHLQSLVHATQSIIVDPEFFQGKTFLNERFNSTLEKTQQRLSEVQNPSNSQVAEEQYAILTKLVLIYNNLKEIKLPLSHPKGKWSWTTEIVDYSSKREQARIQAFDLLMKEGREFVSKNRVKEAEAALMNAVLNYTVDENEKNSYKRVVAGELCSRANSVMRTQVIEEAIIAHEFFKSARKFVSDYAEAKEGESKSATYVSELYIQQGKQIENTKDIEKVITAVESYKNAIKWDGKNQNANDALKAVTERIAEYYYQEGSKAEKAKDYTNAIAQFENVRKWIPDYKDAMSRIYNIRIGGKIEEFAKNVAANRAEFNKLQTRTTSVSSVVDKSAEVMDKVTYVSDKSRSINETMKKTSSTLKLFSIIPVVGSTTNILAKTIDVAQDPIGVVATKFDKLEAPVVTPTKNVVTGTKSVVDNVKGKMGTTDNILKVTEDYSLRMKDRI